MADKGTITHRVAAFHSHDEADAFARESAALYGVEPGELYVTETWNGFHVPSIKLIRLEPNGGGQWLVMCDSIPVAWASDALKMEAGISA